MRVIAGGRTAEAVDGCGSVGSRRAAAVAALVVVLGALVTPSAAAVPPQREELPLALTVEDDGEACGFPVRWEISGHARQVTFFDRDGDATRIVVHVREDNVVTNLATGKTLRDTPVFTQIVHFREDGTLDRVETVGAYVNAGRGRDRVLDVGRAVVAYGPDGPQLVVSSGRHPLREVTLVTGDPAGLAIFCDALSEEAALGPATR